ncbi:MAG: hypothetical protein AB1567_05365 [bacterium]
MVALWIYIVLMALVTLLTVYETVGYYREYARGKERKDMVKFIIKVLVLVSLVILLIQLIHWALNLPEFVTT